MTRICEKYIEELTSGNRQFSGELLEHMAICPECQQAVESLNLLQQHRKTLTGREAASIGAVLKAVKSAGVSDTIIQTASGAGNAAPILPFKYLLIAVLAIVATTSVLINNNLKTSSDGSHQTEQAATNEETSGLITGIDDLRIPVDLTFEQPSNHVASADTMNLASETILSGKNAEETSASPTTEVKMFSPDEEEVRP